MPDYRARAASIQENARREWYRIENRRSNGDATARVYIFDEIGFFGVSAQRFVDELNALEGIRRIELHLNSPGGEVWDAVAILNALRDHPAKVTSIVDGVAASSASFVAMAGDEVVMNRSSELMIHDAWGMAIGNAEDMEDLARRLDQISDNIASIYAARAGGSVPQWRDAMRAETWYTAQEAVDAGLADRVADEEASVENRFDLSIFNYAGRSKAPTPADVPAPETPPAPAEAEPSPVSAGEVVDSQRGAGMDPAKLREAFGLAPDASDEDVRNACTAAGLLATPPSDSAPGPQNPSPQPGPGVQMVDSSVLDRLQQDAAAGQEALARLVRQERDTVIAAAIKDGKFQPSRREHWEQAWDRDPEGTKQAIDGLSKGLIPLSPLGYMNDRGEREEDSLYAELYGEGGR